MGVYVFHVFDPQGAVEPDQRIACRDDLEALAEGLRQSACHSVEIFQGTRLVARVKLGNAPLDTTDPHSL